MTKFQKWLSVLLCLLVIGSFSLHAWADFGDFAGDSDYGDFGDWDDSDYDYDYDSDYDGDGVTFFGDFDGFTLIVVILVIVVAFIGARDKQTPTNNPRPTPTKPTTDNLRPMAEYQKLDPDFNDGELRQKLSNWYVQMQDCWSAGDIEPVRPYFSNAYWEQMNRQLQDMRKLGRTDHTERVAVLNVTLCGFYQAGGVDHITARLNTRIVSYITDRDGKVVSGSKTTEKFMTYEWDLTRPSGAKTEKAAELKSINCPHCGAAISINESAKCPYCDSIITVAKHDWSIATIRGIAQRSN